jgi:outer membrane receptor protein involved in Fe transport
MERPVHSWAASALASRIVAFAALLFFSFAGDGSARADNTADEAQLQFDLGMESAQRNDFRRALEHFLASNRLAPNKNVVFNIAQAYEALGQFPNAFRYYSLALEAEREPSARQPIEDAVRRVSPKVALLDVETDPPGATLYLNRRDLGAIGVSPRALGLPNGRYRVIATLDGYEPAEATTGEIAVGQRAALRLTLKRIQGTVRVEGTPGSAVRADHEESAILCTAPCQAELPPGLHTILVSKEGYQTAALPVDVAANTATILRPVLTPLLGSIVVNADVRGATISVDGSVMGFTPAVLTVPVGRHHVVVSQRGHREVAEDVEVTTEVQAHVTAQLAPSESPLDLSIEAASKASEKESRAPAITTVWTARQIAVMPARTLQDVIKLLPGVDTFDLPDEGRHLAGIRGITEGSILVLVDGQRLNTSIEAPVDIDLPLENIERIELIRGPGSTLYGTYAFTGVINVITKKPAVSEGLVARYRMGVRDVQARMSTGENRLTANAGHALGPLAVGGFFLFAENQGMHPTILADSDTVRRQQFGQNGCTAGAAGCAPLATPALAAPGATREWSRKIEIDLNADYASSVRYKGKLFLEQKEPIVGRNYALNDGTLLDRMRVLQSAELEHEFEHKSFPATRLDARYFFDFHRSEDRFQDQPRGWDEGLLIFGQPAVFLDGKRQDVAIDYVSNLVEVKIDQPVRLRGGRAPELLLTLGSSIEQQQVTRARSFANYGVTYAIPGQLPTQQYESLPSLEQSELFHRPGAAVADAALHPDGFRPSRLIVAGYGQARWDPTPWLTATGGARFDHFSDFGAVISPRAALILAPSGALFFKLLYGHAFNAPSFKNLYLATPEQTTPAGNPDLLPETIDTYEAQVGWQNARARATANA